jgi:SAM-dependent methyltransferase
MKLTPLDPPRVYEAGHDVVVRVSDCGRLHLEPDEQVTFTTPQGSEYDVTRKDWGFYATPSLNARLASFGLRGVLIRNRDGRYFVLLVEAGREAAFERYLAGEKLVVAAWLDTDEALARFAPPATGSAPASPQPACPCGANALEPVFRYAAPPAGEIRFPSAAAVYDRTVSRCAFCGHFVSRHTMDLSALYAGEYVSATYGEDGLGRAFARITALPPERSDNEGRARAVAAFAAGRLDPAAGPPRLLDVGSGLAVFPWRMAREGWDCTALDPDTRAVAHAQATAGVRAVAADFLHDRLDGLYDVVTFNKVLEHVPDPTAMLRRALGLVRPGGFVYIELPDGEAAVADGPEREEFFIDHHHIFSMASLALLVRKAGFVLLRAERLREPSGKYTLRGYLAVS